MSRYEDPEGSGESSGSRQGRGPSDPWEPAGRAGRRGSQMRERPTGIRRILGRHPVLSILGILATLTITFVSLSAYAAYRGVYDSIHHITIAKGELGKRPPKLNGSQNILIIGSDSRAGIHGYGRGIRGSRSDTSMLLHIPPTHSGATVISFPRDTMVPIYQCQADGQGHHGQQAQPGGLEQLNSTFSFGGAPCLWKTLEQVTHIHIDHFVQVDFAGFQSIVNDVGGVPVCLPYAIRDPASKLNLPAGRSVVQGTQALAFVRERHIGMGSDLQRINRQQIFLASLAQKVKQSSSLTNPAKLYNLVHDIASSLTTDSGLSFNDMYAIANSLKGLSPSALQFVMAPVAPYPANPGNQVEFNQPSADQLFRAIARDNHILKTARRADHAKPQPVPTVQPGQVQLQVLNGTSVPNLASITANQLTARGFKVAKTGNATGTTSSTVIEYTSAAQLPQVNTLHKEIPTAQLKQVTSLNGNTISLVLGSGFKGVGTHKGHRGHRGHRGKSTSAAALSKHYGGVNGSANICHESAAFTGPDTPSMFGH
jgi:LCP family protein required for cell wall assembly